MIIAFGESIVAIGVGAAGIALDAGELAAAALGVVFAAALWWVYFDASLEQVEHRLAAATGRARNVMARDTFSFLHLPLVAGIVLLALGVKKTLGDVDEPLKAVSAAALCGGAALYLAADVAFRRRCLGTLETQRLVAAAACAALVPLATQLRVGHRAGRGCRGLRRAGRLRVARARERRGPPALPAGVPSPTGRSRSAARRA